MRWNAAVMTALALVFPVGMVHADGVAGVDGATEPTAQQVIGGAFNRARRATAIGPTVGASGDVAASPGQVDVPLAFGLELSLFKVPIAPSAELMQEVIATRLKARLVQRAKEAAAQGTQSLPNDVEVQALTREIADDVRAEILGQHNIRAKLLEKPRLSLALEGVYLTRAADWQSRTTVRVGIGRISLGPALAVQFGTATGVFLGGEVALSFLPTPSPRSPVVDLFARIDAPLNDAAAVTHIAIGLRFLLDVI